MIIGVYDNDYPWLLGFMIMIIPKITKFWLGLYDYPYNLGLW